MTDVTLLSHGFQSEYEIGFANGLARNGVAVTLIGSDSTLLDRRAPGVTTVNLRGSQDPRRPRLGKVWNLANYIISYLAYLASHRGARVHVIGMFTTGNTLLSLMEAWLTRLVAGPYLLTVHNVLPHNGHSNFNRRLFNIIYRIPGSLMVHTARTADSLVRLYGLPREAIQVVEHGFDRAIPPDAQVRARQRVALNIPAEAGVILFFGQVHRYKGLDLLLQAFETCGANPLRHLVIAGPCRDGSLRAELLRIIEQHPYHAQIHWQDEFVPEAQVAPLMQMADCMAMPYRHIDQSGVLFMALSASLPVVATDVGSLAHYIRVGEVVPVGDVPAFAAALARTLDAPASNGSRSSDFTRYEWRNTVAALARAYDTPYRGDAMAESKK